MRSGTELRDRTRPARRRVTLCLAVVAVLVAGCTGGTDRPAAAPATRVFEVAWVNQGVTGTDPWTTSHAAAARSVERELGAGVHATVVDDVQLGDEARAVMEDLIRDGTRLIFVTSYAFADDVRAVARAHPDVMFEHARGDRVTGNVSTYSGAHEQAVYLAGVAAGGMSRAGRIAYVAPVSEPETIRLIDAFTLGARSVRPDAVVDVRWVGSWWDPARERLLAEQLIADGADVVATGSTSTGSGEAASAAGLPWVGHDADWSAQFEGSWVTASLPDWSRYYQRRVREAMHGRWSAGAYYGDMADGFVGLAPFGPRVPAALRSSISERRSAIVDGSLDVFAGPIRDQAGRPRVAEGRALPMQERLALDWFVQGVLGPTS